MQQPTFLEMLVLEVIHRFLMAKSVEERTEILLSVSQSTVRDLTYIAAGLNPPGKTDAFYKELQDIFNE